MNITSGGPHILLFERDQQLSALLTSELQLAGYTCHIARTAVEVFDIIAHFPIRMVLVNLAQAASGRREFWVALDTQQRGRGLQVLTFRCMDFTGYGPDDPDEHPHTVAADREVRGMSDITNLMSDIRSRIPVPSVVPPLSSTPVSTTFPMGKENGKHTTSTLSDANSVPLSTLPLRISPIQDIPPSTNSINSHEDQRGPDTSFSTSYIQRQASTKPPSIPPTPKTPMTTTSAMRAITEYVETHKRTQPLTEAAAEEILATKELELRNLVQALPPVLPQTQPEVLNGQVTRSLESVLSEGHLIPQERLEVAKTIQRMLGGVDMNYQLDEILLMFKLLSPDQVIASKLVSNGLLSTAQIGALSRIRQELYAIGIKYDLENLIILFGILSAEQIREVRSSF